MWSRLEQSLAFNARILIADGSERPRAAPRKTGNEPVQTTNPDRIRLIIDRIEKRREAENEARRMEDDIREELRDSRAKTITSGR
jgi:hypothetical protein